MNLEQADTLAAAVKNAAATLDSALNGVTVDVVVALPVTTA